MMKYGGILLALVLTVALWLVELSGLFNAPNGWLYDRLTVLQADNSKARPSVLLIDSSSIAPAAPAQWNTLLAEIHRHKPALVAFMSEPPVSIQPADKRYVIGIAAERLLPGYRSPVGEQATVSLDNPLNVVLPRPLSDDGIYRYAQLYDGEHEAFSLAVAQRVKPAIDVPGKSLRINFNHGTDWLPVVSFRRAVEGGLVNELVENRVVLIGPVSLQNGPGMMTPVFRDSGLMSQTEFEGYTIETLLRGDYIGELSALQKLLLLIIISLASMLAYQKMRIASVWRVTLVLLVMYHLIAWAELHWVALWLPLFPLLLLQLILFVITIRVRHHSGEEALYQVLADAGSWVRGHLLPERFYESEQHWAKVMNLVDQSLDLQRLIFLERVEGDHRVREVSALRCSIDDIGEQRRDYERTPYSTAIEQAGPIVLNRPFMRELDEPETQYLVPLIYSGDVVGFWSFSVSPGKLEDAARFESMVKAFAVQIAEILYHRSVWRDERASADRSLLGSFVSVSDSVNQHVIRILNSVERRWSMIEQVLGGLGTATVLYDPFGQVLSANKAMEKLARKLGISVYDMSALDMLSHVTELSPVLAREALSAVLFRKEEVTFPVNVKGSKDIAYLLSVSPIERGSEGVKPVDEAMPFDISGLLFEMVDVVHLSRDYLTKTRFMERMIIQLRSDLGSVVTGMQMLDNDRIEKPQRERTIELVSNKVEKIDLLLTEADRMIHFDMTEMARQSYPVDTLSVIKGVLAGKQQELQDKGVSLLTEFPNLMHLGMAQKETLVELLNYIIDLQVKDAGPGSEISFKVNSKQDAQCMSISSTGYGMPDEELQRYLNDSDLQVSDEFMRLREAIDIVSSWGGKLSVNSELGKGMHFGLKLRSVV